MRLAILGTRGIPARYGGFETFAEELSRRLAGRGHDVMVYCRAYLYRDLSGAAEGGAGAPRRVLLPCLRTKHLETLSHTFLSIVHLWKLAITGKPLPDAVLICNGANAPLLPLIRLLGIPAALNVDGIERRRAKWGSAGALWYTFGEWCSARFASVVISDAEVIREYYLRAHDARSEVIPYGYNEQEESEVQERLEGKHSTGLVSRLAELDLTPGGYILYVSRLEPENNAHVVLAAYSLWRAAVPPEQAMPLIIVGDAPYADQYIAGLRSAAVEGVRFLGFRFGECYRALQLGAAIYIQATEVGGTHPALVEAMGFGGCVIANRTPENSEVLGESGRFYERNDAQSLASVLGDLTRSPEERRILMARARARAREHYSWAGVVASYEALCLRLKNRTASSTPLDRAA